MDGSGTIYIHDPSKPNFISGNGTSFLKDVQPNSVLALKDIKCDLKVAQVVSDTELFLVSDVSDDKALHFLQHPKGVAYSIIPHVDQGVLYKAVHDRLNSGECIGIFPEGGSHDRTEILPLKGNSAASSKT
jgi:glycerol-3-phosphate O-acyltransferase/dihydroxyacetone phosphate acyltransferase